METFFSPDGPTTTANVGYSEITDEQAAIMARRQLQGVTPERTRSRRRHLAQLNVPCFDLLAIIFLLVPLEEREAIVRVAREEEEAAGAAE